MASVEAVFLDLGNVLAFHDDAVLFRRMSDWGGAEPDVIRDTYAALLFKDKQYVSAERHARQAIEIGRKSEEDVSSTEKLLEQILRASAGK